MYRYDDALRRWLFFSKVWLPRLSLSSPLRLSRRLETYLAVAYHCVQRHFVRCFWRNVTKHARSCLLVCLERIYRIFAQSAWTTVLDVLQRLAPQSPLRWAHKRYCPARLFETSSRHFLIFRVTLVFIAPSMTPPSLTLLTYPIGLVSCSGHCHPTNFHWFSCLSRSSDRLELVFSLGASWEKVPTLLRALIFVQRNLQINLFAHFTTLFTTSHKITRNYNIAHCTDKGMAHVLVRLKPQELLLVVPGLDRISSEEVSG